MRTSTTRNLLREMPDGNTPDGDLEKKGLSLESAGKVDKLPPRDWSSFSNHDDSIISDEIKVSIANRAENAIRKLKETKETKESKMDKVKLSAFNQQVENLQQLAKLGSEFKTFAHRIPFSSLMNKEMLKMIVVTRHCIIVAGLVISCSQNA